MSSSESPPPPPDSHRTLGSLNPPPAGESPSKRSAALSPMDPPQLPDELGRLGGYRILRIIGHGGMGVVYEAEDPNLRRHVAIKCLLGEVALRKGNKERFLREARATAAVEHENVIPIHAVGIDNDVPFLVMPLLKGHTLKHRIAAEKQLPLAEVLRITREICHGLKAAHDRGLIHRDIKPENIWLDGKTGKVRILDFGLARINDDQDMRSQGGQLVGTPGYISPEQIAGEEVDLRSDLFSLGCLVYEMATGQPPFSGSNFLALLSNVTTETPADPNSINPQLPAILSALILKLIEKHPDKRPANVQEVLDVLSHFETTQSLPANPPEKPGVASPVPDSTETSATKRYYGPIAGQKDARAEEPDAFWQKDPRGKTEPSTPAELAVVEPAPSRWPLVLLALSVLFVATVGLTIVWMSQKVSTVASGTVPSADTGLTVPSSPPTRELTPPTEKLTPPTRQSPPTKLIPTPVAVAPPPRLAPPTQPPPPVIPKRPPGEEDYERGLKLARSPMIPRDYAQAFRAFERAAKVGYEPAVFQVGYAQYFGLGTKWDRIGALETFRRGDALKQPLATFALGLSECEGTAQRRNLSRGEARIRTSISAVRQLAEAGDTQAMVLLGDALLEGYSVPIDREAAAALFRKAALARDPNAILHLANCYKEGWGVLQDDETRLTLLKQARDDGFTISYAFLADLYREGKLAPPDLPEAARLYKLAADNGYALARLREASVLNQQKKVEEAKAAYTQAMAEIKPLAEAGDRRAQYDLAVLFIRDDSLPMYQQEAARWIQKAAEQDHPQAQYRLGQFYWKGIGVEKDLIQARVWFRKAADQGVKEADEALKALDP